MEDAAKRTVRIPPDFAKYAEEKGIFDILECAVQELLVAEPDDPLQFFIDYLGRKGSNVPRVLILGPPVVGKRSIGKRVADSLRCVLVDVQRLVAEEDSQFSSKELAPTQLVEFIAERLAQPDCLNKGWVLVHFPENRQQALQLQAAGVIPRHVVHLEAADSVLKGRFSGKRLDPITGEVYHVTFAPPPTREVFDRVVQTPGGLEGVGSKVALYRRCVEGLLNCYQSLYKSFDADQPIDDVASQVMTFLRSQGRRPAPTTPRIVILGPTGSGKGLITSHLCRKYNLVNVAFKDMINQVLQSNSSLADLIQPFHQKGILIPDDLLLQIVSDRLNQLDCVSRGWVLQGFPLTREQAELLDKAGHTPSRVYFFDVPVEVILERLSLRRIDPVSGTRYHLLYDPPVNEDIKQRLKVHPNDTEEEVQRRVREYQDSLEDLLTYYKKGQHVNADQDPNTVFEIVEGILINSLQS